MLAVNAGLQTVRSIGRSLDEGKAINGRRVDLEVGECCRVSMDGCLAIIITFCPGPRQGFLAEERREGRGKWEIA